MVVFTCFRRNLVDWTMWQWRSEMATGTREIIVTCRKNNKRIVEPREHCEDERKTEPEAVKKKCLSLFCPRGKLKLVQIKGKNPFCCLCLHIPPPPSSVYRASAEGESLRYGKIKYSLGYFHPKTSSHFQRCLQSFAIGCFTTFEMKPQKFPFQTELFAPENFDTLLMQEIVIKCFRCCINSRQPQRGQQQRERRAMSMFMLWRWNCNVCAVVCRLEVAII